MLGVADNFCARVGCRILIWPALIIAGLPLLWRWSIVQLRLGNLRCCCDLLLGYSILTRSLWVTGWLFFASEDVWIGWLFLLLISFVWLFKFEIFWSYDCRANLLWWLKILQHQKLARLFWVCSVVGCVRLDVNRWLRILNLAQVSWLDDPDFRCVSNILIISPLLVYRAKIDTTHEPSLTWLLYLFIQI